jgi:uncharacterized metal-binding protein
VVYPTRKRLPHTPKDAFTTIIFPSAGFPNVGRVAVFVAVRVRNIGKRVVL